MYLETINSPADVKKLSMEQLPMLAEEMRQALLLRASRHGGHFGPNFGMVEATIALHYVFDSPKDKIIFDVSHQSYPHKMLTGRKDAYLYPEHYDDVSGYSNPDESEHDFFTVGHTSTSVSLACGMAKARDLKGECGNVIAVIGDGSLSGGEAQRVKLAKELHRQQTGKTFYILDEPTTGLHFEDVRQLVEVLERLVDAGNTVLVIEHNLDVIKMADRVLDMGPEGGNGGGTVVAYGTPEQVAKVPESHTGRFLAPILERDRARQAAKGE